jgi:hypothetical protein
MICKDCAYENGEHSYNCQNNWLPLCEWCGEDSIEQEKFDIPLCYECHEIAVENNRAVDVAWRTS